MWQIEHFGAAVDSDLNRDFCVPMGSAKTGGQASGSSVLSGVGAWAAATCVPHRSFATTWMAAATGMASKAAAKPPNSPPIHASDAGADDHRHEDEEGIDPDGPAHDHRVEDVILELRVDEEHDGGDDAGPKGLGQGEEHRRECRRALRRSWQEINEGHPEPPQQRVGHAEQGECGEDHDASHD